MADSAPDSWRRPIVRVFVPLVEGGLQRQTGTSRIGVLFMRTKSLEVFGEDPFSVGSMLR
jgi:hypothetical protein